MPRTAEARKEAGRRGERDFLAFAQDHGFTTEDRNGGRQSAPLVYVPGLDLSIPTPDIVLSAAFHHPQDGGLIRHHSEHDVKNVTLSRSYGEFSMPLKAVENHVLIGELTGHRAPHKLDGALITVTFDDGSTFHLCPNDQLDQAVTGYGEVQRNRFDRDHDPADREWALYFDPNSLVWKRDTAWAEAATGVPLDQLPDLTRSFAEAAQANARPRLRQAAHDKPKRRSM